MSDKPMRWMCDPAHVDANADNEGWVAFEGTDEAWELMCGMARLQVYSGERPPKTFESEMKGVM